jgi:hypothetical protein
VGVKLRNKRNKIGEDFYPFLRRSIVVELVTAGITSSKFLQEKVTGLFLFWGIGEKRGGKLIKTVGLVCFWQEIVIAAIVFELEVQQI